MAIRWGIVGCGDVTEVKSGPAFQRAEGSQLAAVMRRRGELAADYARRHGVPVWYDDASALIGDARVDAVYIATPPGEHARLALAACAAGKPAYVEKPMARNHAECERMVEAFRSAGVPLFVAYYRRALDRFLKARELVRSGALGTLTSISYRFAGPYHRDVPAGSYHGISAASLPWRLQAEHSGGGLFLDLGSHTLDILDFIVAPLEQVSGHAANRASSHEVEDSVAMSFMCAGVPGVAAWNFAAAVRVDEILISGDAGELRLSTFGNEPVELRSGEEVERFELPNPAHIQQPLIQSIVRALSGRGSCESTGVSAARTSAVMDRVLASYYGSRDDAFWERPDTWPGRRPG
jgi:1,5-anhydro-D-fructose reductase (1,5-anhydro-D-mannitol-forming)